MNKRPTGYFRGAKCEFPSAAIGFLGSAATGGWFHGSAYSQTPLTLSGKLPFQEHSY